jgi:hypothetical protein
MLRCGIRRIENTPRKKRENQKLTPEFCIFHKDSPLVSTTIIAPNIALDKNLPSVYQKNIININS